MAINDRIKIDEWGPDSISATEMAKYAEMIRNSTASNTLTPEFYARRLMGDWDIAKKEPEEWVWVEGYKGMDKNMQGHDHYQFEVGKRYDMPEGAEIRACESGFHFGLNLNDVFHYFGIGKGNRFFKVKALVRKKDLDGYGKGGTFYRTNKLASKSIEIVRELTPDEIFTGGEEANWTYDEKLLALQEGKAAVHQLVWGRKLVELGYSQVFAKYCATHDKFDIAYVVGHEDISMDMKVFAIFND